MGDKVVSLNGAPVPEKGKPSTFLIEWLEDRLIEARSGELQGMAGSVLDHNREASFFVIGNTGGFSMVGGLECAQRRLTAIAMGDLDPGRAS